MRVPPGRHPRPGGGPRGDLDGQGPTRTSDRRSLHRNCWPALVRRSPSRNRPSLFAERSCAASIRRSWETSTSSDNGGHVSRDPATKPARFIYISDADRGSAWHTPKDDGRLRVGWRLIAANNRSLGRSWVVYGTFEACVAAAAQLHDRLEEVTPAVTFDSRHAAWT